jgi:NAD(P)-dependent dehydrogenase (short-subunit alcohol dehydrogenase family)
MTTKNIKGTVLITGANGGLATVFIDQLIETNPPYLGVFTVRGNSAQSSAALRKLVSNTSFPHSILTLDLDDLASVRNFAKDINSKVSGGKLPKIRALILNAAIQTFKGITYTKDGIEMTFGVNYLANFLLVLLLLESMDPEMGRIVIVSSFTHDPEYSYNSSFATDKIVFKSPEVMAHPQEEKGDQWAYGMRRYGLSKLLMLMFMYSTPLHVETNVLGMSFNVV